MTASMAVLVALIVATIALYLGGLYMVHKGRKPLGAVMILAALGTTYVGVTFGINTVQGSVQDGVVVDRHYTPDRWTTTGTGDHQSMRRIPERWVITVHGDESGKNRNVGVKESVYRGCTIGSRFDSKTKTCW